MRVAGSEADEAAHDQDHDDYGDDDESVARHDEAFPCPSCGPGAGRLLLATQPLATPSV
jgi:hypothetical protein